MRLKLLLILIVILGFLLRVYKLDQFPQSLYGDEQSFAWNAYNILKLEQDEYGNPYPLQFRSFEDYKAPIPVYLLVPFIKFLGLNSFSIRLPIAAASVLTVLVVYFLAKRFFNDKISLIITFLMAISPWHIHLSRGFFEATLALLWFILGIYFFLRFHPYRGETLTSKGNGGLKILLVSMLFFALSLYSYFSPRILVPIFLVFFGWYSISFSRSLHPWGAPSGHPRGVFKAFLLSVCFLIFLSLPLLKLTLFDKGFSRFSKLFETNNRIVVETVNKERNASNLPDVWRIIFHNKVTVWFRIIKNNYLEHLSLNFWYIYGDNSLRYFTGNMGMFYLVEMPFMLMGLYFLWREKRKAAIFFIGWLLLAPIPAALVGRSFAVRSLAMLPAPFIFVGYGLYKLLQYSPSRSSLQDKPFCHLPGVAKGRTVWCIPKRLLPGVIAFGFALSLGSLLIRYYLEYPVYAATWWGWENKAAIDYARLREDMYDKIFISNFYSGATLAFAVYTNYDPLDFRRAIRNPIVMADGRHLIKLGKYYFGSLDIDEDRLKQEIIPPKSLYIGRPEEADSDETINAPDDGRVIFKIYQTK